MKLSIVSSYVLASLISISVSQVRASDFELTGYKLLSKSYVEGEFEGADFDKTVSLDNGMIFEFNTYYYTYSYRPEVSVFLKALSISRQKQIGIKNPKNPITLYKLLIQDHVYDVFRVR